MEISMSKILVIDDDPMITQLCKNYFRVKGHNVTIARNGKEGLKIFDRERFDLVITDLMMPETHGFQVIDAIKMSKKGASIPILLLSADINEEELREYDRKRLPDETLAKPFDIPDLERKVKDLLEQFSDR